MTKKLKSAEWKQAFEKRQRVWRHNSFRGQARMAEINLKNMMESDSLSKEAKHCAAQAIGYITVLSVALKTRIDPQ